MNRKEVRKIAAQYKNPALTAAIERFQARELTWEEAINTAVVELVKQNDYFLDKLIQKSDITLTPKPAESQQPPGFFGRGSGSPKG